VDGAVYICGESRRGQQDVRRVVSLISFSLRLVVVVVHVQARAASLCCAADRQATDASKLCVAVACRHERERGVAAWAVKRKTGKSKGTSPNNQCLCSPFNGYSGC
jgi:hypothetical protein